MPNPPAIDETETTTLATVPTTPEAMLAHAIALHLAPESMERFYAIYERMCERKERAAFNNAMAVFRERCGLVAKSKKAEILMRSGGKFTFNYSPIEEVAATINPVLIPLGVSYGFDEARDDKGVTVTCIVKHRDGHQERYSGWCPYDFDAKMSPANMTTSAWTTARRKALMGAFGLIAVDEADLEASGGGGEKVTAHQADTLDTMLSEFPAERRAKFLHKIGYPSLADIPASRYNEAVGMIEKARANK